MPRAAVLAVGHDKGLHRGVPHGFEHRRGLRLSLSQKARHGGASPAPIVSTSWLENNPVAQVVTMVPPPMAAPRPDTGLSFKQRRAHQEGQQAQTSARQPYTEQEATQWRNKLANKQAATAPRLHVPP
jgi:hypothetical protein